MNLKKEKKKRKEDEIVRQYSMEGKSIHEIAKCLGISVSKVKHTIYKNHAIQEDIVKKGAGLEEVYLFYRKRFFVGENIKITKKGALDDDFLSEEKAVVAGIYHNFFRVCYQNRPWSECFCYGDLFTEEVKVIY